jgi:hypothetical protein
LGVFGGGTGKDSSDLGIDTKNLLNNSKFNTESNCRSVNLGTTVKTVKKSDVPWMRNSKFTNTSPGDLCQTEKKASDLPRKIMRKMNLQNLIPVKRD